MPCGDQGHAILDQGRIEALGHGGLPANLFAESQAAQAELALPGIDGERRLDFSEARAAFPTPGR